MTDSLRDRIAAVLESHQRHSDPNPINDWCMCGSYNETAWREHVADAVIAALGLTVERDGPPIVPPCHRYITDWFTDD